MCLSVKLHLTFGASVRRENAATYSAGSEGQKICGVFFETVPLQRCIAPFVGLPYIKSAIFPAEARMPVIVFIPRGDRSGHFLPCVVKATVNWKFL